MENKNGDFLNNNANNNLKDKEKGNEYVEAIINALKSIFNIMLICALIIAIAFGACVLFTFRI